MERHFRDLLRGLKPGIAQECGMTCVIPLISESEILSTIGDVDNLRIGTERYGTVVVENLNDEPTIIPSGLSILTKQIAQDHCIPFTKVIGGKKVKGYNKCCCVQDSQGGAIQKDKHEVSMLPHPLRESVYEIRNVDKFGKLWDSLRNFSVELGGNIGHNGWLVDFIDTHKDSLTDFVSHFEPVDNQLGAIILINGKVAGIEVVPSYKMWNVLWKPLIKECYGSLALWMNNKVKFHSSRTRVKMNESNIKTVSDIRAEYDRVLKEEQNIVSQIIRETIDEPLTRVQTESEFGFTINTYENTKFCGQSIERNGIIIYGSFISKRTHLIGKNIDTPFVI